MIKRISFILVGTLILVAFGVVLRYYMTIPREEGRAYLKPAVMGFFSPLSTYSLSHAISEKDRPKGLLDLPREISDNDIRFLSIPVGNNPVFVIIQKPSPDKANAWIDTNMDNRLSDETPLTGTAKKYTQNNTNWRYFDFGNIRLKSEEFTSAPFKLTCHKERNYVSIQPISYMKGKIRLEGQVYEVAIIDGDYDKKYDTLYTPSEKSFLYPACDTFYFAKSGFFKNRQYIDTPLPLGRYYKDNFRYFDINIASDGSQLQMKPAMPVYGRLKIPENKHLSVKVLSDAASQEIMLENEIEVPVGNYQMHWGNLTYTDQTGNSWSFRPSFNEDIRKGQFEIKEGQTVTINPGPPFKVKTDIHKAGDKLRIGAGLTGNEGEEYGLRLPRSSSKPILKIFDEKGTEMHTGQMEYG